MTADAFWLLARQGSPIEGLRALGRFISGYDCYPAFGNHALRGKADRSTPVGDMSSADSSALCARFGDPALDAFALELVDLPRRLRTSRQTATAKALLLRAAWLAGMLDTAHRHLSTRQSGGIPTLQHQLIKATFTECHSLADQIRLEVRASLNGMCGLDVNKSHEALTAATSKAAKLMGGHGYLLGSLNSLEWLSLVVANLSLQRAAAATVRKPLSSHFPAVSAALDRAFAPGATT